ncbi:MAG: hypothetical protein GY913_29735 [Proteobacteria bacterium]|nr:hypothetical protein [Pseudomonadota bacterium]MCP4921097.1 hypothetical protein [Pseudomonadota bacterium]
MLRVHAESTIVVLLQGVWDESQLAELERSEPLLARRLENVAASTRFGSGRMPGSAAQAAMTLGAPRVRHVAAWHVLLDALGEQGTPEAVTLAAHALVDAEADPFAAMTCAMASRLGWRLLRSSQPVAPAVARLVAAAGGRDVERAVFGRTSEDMLYDFIAQVDLPHDLAALIIPMPESPEEAIQSAALERAGDPPGVAFELARMLEVTAGLVEVVDASELAACVADVLSERSDLDTRIEALQRQVEELQEDDRGVGDGIDANTAEGRLEIEVARATRYKRRLTVVAGSIQPGDYDLPPHTVLEHLAERLRGAVRVCDVVGVLDRTTLLIVLPETDVRGGRAFAERNEYMLRTRPIELHGVIVPLRPKFYVTSLQQEGDPKAPDLLASVVDGVRGMRPDQRVLCNDRGQSIWRTSSG